MCVFLFIGACTHNDGNIGKQFGQWQLQRIEKNGAEDVDYGGNIFWSFQNSTIEMKCMEDDHTSRHTFGNYRIEGDVIILNFPDDERPPLEVLGLQRSDKLRILRMNHSEMTLVHDGNNDTGDKTIFYFHKW